MSIARVAAAVLVAALLASCRTVPPRAVTGPGADAPWPEQRAALEKLDRYGLNGRVAVAANGQGFSASLRYTQSLDRMRFSLEGPLGMTECSLHAGACGIEHSCGVRANWRRINDVVADALRGVSLAQMLAPPPQRTRKAIPATLATA